MVPWFVYVVDLLAAEDIPSAEESEFLILLPPEAGIQLAEA